MAKHVLYNTWRSMIQRCHSPKNPSFGSYGARGIRVCDRWRASFADFLSDVGARPTPKHTLDRIEGTRGYEPGNVRWATRREQSENRFDNVYVTLAGRRQTLTAWAREYNIHPATVHARYVQHGWSLEAALTTPPDHRFHPDAAVRESHENGRNNQLTTNSDSDTQVAVGR